MSSCHQVSFTASEVDSIANLLSLLVLNLNRGADEIDRICPGTRIAETFRMQADTASDLIDKIDASSIV